MPSKIEQGKDLELLTSLKGKHVRIPDLGPIFSSWPKGVNKHYEALKEATDEFLESFEMKEKKLKKQIEIDYALSGSMWWQQADFNELRAVTFFVIWLFNYDDDIDEPTGQHSGDLESARGVHRTAISFIEHCLGLSEHGDINTPRNPNISCFKVIGDQLRVEYSGEQRQAFLDEMTLYLEACAQEQEARQRGEVLSVEEYWTLRKGTSAVGLCTSLADLANKLHTSEPFTRDPEVLQLREETNFIISMVNDLLSLKKEMALGCILSHVPLACTVTPDVQCVIDEAIEALHSSVTRFDAIAERLLSRPDLACGEKRDFDDFIRVCRENCVGNWTWSLVTSRYGIQNDGQEDGSVSFAL